MDLRHDQFAFVCSSYQVESANMLIQIFKRPLEQRFSNFFQVGTTFISENVLRTTLSCPL
jgi:hypothetical protein